MLAGKVIYITGAAGLIGRSFTKACLDQGAQVVCSDIDPKSLDEFKQTFSEEIQQRICCVVTDITNKESIVESLDRAVEAFSKVDVLVNNAYPRNKNYGRKFFDVTYSDFSENISMNLGGYFLTSQVFAKYFSERKDGNIINISSIYGVIAPKFEVYEGTPMTMPVEYAAIKSGVIHLSKYMAKFLKGTGVRVNILSPGGIFNEQDPTFVNQYREFCCNKGMLDVGDLNGSLVFLCSEASKYINGQNVTVDDGFTL